MLGPLLAEHGSDPGRVLEAARSANEHERGMTLAGLLQVAPMLTPAILTELDRFKQRWFAIEPFAYRLKSLDAPVRAMVIDEVIQSAGTVGASLLQVIADQLVIGDSEIPRVVDAARRLRDPISRAHILATCVAVVDSDEGDAIFREVMEAARQLGPEARLVQRLGKQLEGHGARLLDVVQVLRELGDGNALAYATDTVAALLAKQGHVREAIEVAERVLASSGGQSPYVGINVLASIANVISRNAYPAQKWATASRFVCAILDSPARAVGMAVLLRAVPLDERTAWLHRLADETARLPGSFDRSWTAANQLTGALDDERPAVLALAVAGVPEVINLRQRARLVHRIWLNMSDAERGAHTGILNQLINNLLTSGDAISAGWIEEFVPFFDEAQTRRAQESRHSFFTSLSLKIAVHWGRLGHWQEAWDQLSSLADQLRCSALAMLIPYAPLERKDDLLKEVRAFLNGDARQSDKSEPASLFLPYFGIEERRSAIEAIAKAALAIHMTSTRREVLERVATAAASDIPMPRRSELLSEFFDCIAKRRRADFADDFAALAPLFLAVDGAPAVRDAAIALADAGQLFA